MGPSSRAFSPAHSMTGTSSYGGPVPVRIVSKVAIEGRAKRGHHEGAYLRLFLKIALPAESAVEGASIPLFAEEHIRIMTSSVHPLDASGAPYAFSSNQKLLHRTARALNLPAPSSKSYYAALGMTPPPPSPSDGQLYRKTSAAPLTVALTGEINVSNFHICFNLPKVFPTKQQTDFEREVNGGSARFRRSSFSDRPTYLFMAGVEIWAPFLSRPPQSPWLLSIPLPVCLQNNIKLRIFPTERAASDDDEEPHWDLASEPYVTRTYNDHVTRGSSMESFADDESSLSDDYSSSSSAGYGVNLQGTFPSCERIRIRWAQASVRELGQSISDGRRRVGIDRVQSTLKCVVLGREPNGFRVKLDYAARCMGLWFPGVATMLGLDVALDTKGREVTWGDDEEKWEISGEKGFTGFDYTNTGGRPRSPSGEKPVTPSRPSLVPARSQASGNGPSLLRTPLPLPANSEDDISFETTSPGTPSVPTSISSSYFASQGSPRPPTQTVMLQVNMDDLKPYPKNEYAFKISGTILLPVSQSEDEEIIKFPVFKVLGATNEHIDVTLRSELPDGLELVEMRGPTPRKRIVRRRSEVRTDDGAGVLFQPNRPKRTETPSPAPRLNAFRAGTHTPATVARANAQLASEAIPYVRLRLSPLPLSRQYSHAVHLIVPPPATSTLQFGLPLPMALSSSPPSIQLVSATMSGRSLPSQVFPHVARDGPSPGLPVNERKEEDPQHEWASWIRIHTEGNEPPDEIEILYLVGRVQGEHLTQDLCHALLPCFPSAVGYLEATVDTVKDHSFLPFVSNLDYGSPDLRKLQHYNLPPNFDPNLVLTLKSLTSSSYQWQERGISVGRWVLRMLPIILLFLVWSLGTEVRSLRHAIEKQASPKLSPPIHSQSSSMTAGQSPSVTVDPSSVLTTSIVAPTESSTFSVPGGQPTQTRPRRPPSQRSRDQPFEEPLRKPEMDHTPPWERAFYRMMEFLKRDFPESLPVQALMETLRSVWSFAQYAFHYPANP